MPSKVRRHWTPNQIECLRTSLEEGGFALAVERLPQFSRSAIFNKAQYHGFIHVDTYQSSWAEDDVILRAQFAALGAAGVAALLNGRRSVQAVKKRAFLLGLRRTAGRPDGKWTEAELALVRAHLVGVAAVGRHAKETAFHALLRALPGRTHVAVTEQVRKVREAMSLAINVEPAVWTEEEDRELRAAWAMNPNRYIKRICALLGRTNSSVRNRAYDLGLTHSRKPRRTRGWALA